MAAPSPRLLEPLKLRSVEIPNRIAIAPMCQYSAEDGFVNDWHLVHLGRFVLGGAGVIFVEATAVVPEGRITYGDLGLWDDDHIPGLKRIVAFIKANGEGERSGTGDTACPRRPQGEHAASVARQRTPG